MSGRSARGGVGQAASVQAGRPTSVDHQADGAVGCASTSRAALGLGRLTHEEAGLFEGLHHQHAHKRLVLDHEHAVRSRAVDHTHDTLQIPPATDRCAFVCADCNDPPHYTPYQRRRTPSVA